MYLNSKYRAMLFEENRLGRYNNYTKYYAIQYPLFQYITLFGPIHDKFVKRNTAVHATF